MSRTIKSRVVAYGVSLPFRAQIVQLLGMDLKSDVHIKTEKGLS